VAKGVAFEGLAPDKDPGYPYAGEPLYHIPYMGDVDPVAVKAALDRWGAKEEAAEGDGADEPAADGEPVAAESP